MKRRRRNKRTMLQVGDAVEARMGDDWFPGKVSRSLFRGVEVDVRLEDGRMARNLTSKDVRRAESIVWDRSLADPFLFTDEVNKK